MKKILLMLLACVLMQTAAECDPVRLDVPPPSVQPRIHMFNPFPAFFAWLDEPWIGDDAPYAALRSQIENAQRAGRLDAVVQDARSEYAKNPSSHEVQFKYFYSIWLNKSENDVDYPYADEANVSDFSANLIRSLSKYPRTYNFTRMAALSNDIWSEERHEELLPFAKRLEIADRNDVKAKRLVPTILASTDQAKLQEQAIQIDDELVMQYPDNADIQCDQGYAYYRRWTSSHDPSTAQLAIVAYERYLRLDKPNDYFRPIALHVIEILQKSIASAQQPKS